MSRDVYRYRFQQDLPFTEVFSILNLAIVAIESLYGESRSRLDARFSDDPISHTITIDASTDVGQNLNEVFVGFARQEFGDGAFRVERVDRLPVDVPTGAAA